MTIRHYRGETIDVTYDIRRCIHAAECVRGLPTVFEPRKRPWILPSAASADAIARVVARCPSGALHFTRLDGGAAEVPDAPTTVMPTAGGPLYVRGRLKLRSADGRVMVEETRVALCRCGRSENKPFCDNSHYGAGFGDAGAITTDLAG